MFVYAMPDICPAGKTFPVIFQCLDITLEFVDLLFGPIAAALEIADLAVEVDPVICHSKDHQNNHHQIHKYIELECP